MAGHYKQQQKTKSFIMKIEILEFEKFMLEQKIIDIFSFFLQLGTVQTVTIFIVTFLFLFLGEARRPLRKQC